MTGNAQDIGKRDSDSRLRDCVPGIGWSRTPWHGQSHRRRMLHVQTMQTVLLAMEYGVPGE
jgi:hypothetical protein